MIRHFCCLSPSSRDHQNKIQLKEEVQDAGKIAQLETEVTAVRPYFLFVFHYHFFSQNF